MTFEKLNESTLMVDLRELQKGIMKAMVIQFGYIITFCTFVPTCFIFCLIASIISLIVMNYTLKYFAKRNLNSNTDFNCIEASIQFIGIYFWVGVFIQYFIFINEFMLESEGIAGKDSKLIGIMFF